MAHIQKQLRDEGTVHFPNGSHSPQKVSQELHQDLHHWVKAYGPEDYSHHEHQLNADIQSPDGHHMLKSLEY
nr:hypothetical protein Iba_chr01cCG12300 [Ipomoea batatas]